MVDGDRSGNGGSGGQHAEGGVGAEGGGGLRSAGWYEDEQGIERYWDGSAWTDRTIGGSRQDYLVMLGFFFAFTLPLVGFIIGAVVALRRNREQLWTGNAILLTAGVASVLWWLVLVGPG